MEVGLPPRLACAWSGLVAGGAVMGGLQLLAASEPAQNLSIFEPVSPPAESIRNLSILVLAICGFIFVAVELILFYAIFRFRRKGPASAADVEPPQVYGSKPIEIAWTAAPALVVFILVMVTTRTLWDVNRIPPKPEKGDNALFVTVVGRQWWWEYRYEHFNGEKLDFITANELHIPAGAKVWLKLRSADVCHSFWVPRLSGKTDLIPGRENYLWFQTDRAGEWFLGQCAEYCGTQHANMLLRVRVDSPEEFKVWWQHEQEKRKQPAKNEKDSVRRGRELFLSQSCTECHVVRGTAARRTKDPRKYAPDLTHLMSRQTLASGMIPNNGEELRKWIRNPQKTKPGCLMAPFNFSDEELDTLVDFLLTLD
jgi:cytochrome c oxidase subunit 2